jgi:hypothetical protein
MARRGREPGPVGASSAGGGAGYGELEIAGGADSADDGATLLEARPMVVAQPPPPPPSSRPNLTAASPRGAVPMGRATSPGAPPPPNKPSSRPALQAQGSRPPPPPSARPSSPGAAAQPPRPPVAPQLPHIRTTSTGASRPVPPTLPVTQPPQPTGESGSTTVQRGVRASQLGAANGLGSTGPQSPLSLAPEVRPPPPAAPPPAAAGGLEAIFAVPALHGAAQGTLSDEDVASLEALRTSMEKGALVLRAIAELCVDKGVFTREEMKSRAK